MPKIEKRKGGIVIRREPGDRELTLAEKVERLERLTREIRMPVAPVERIRMVK